MHRRMFPLAVTAALAGYVLGSLAAPASAANAIGNPQQGKRDFAVCAACHQVGPHAKNGVGPVLNGIVGRKAGSYPGYSYSPANKNSGLTWSVAELQKYLANPRKVVPGTKMPFAGLHDQKKVDNIIAYLAQFNEEGEKAAE